MLVFAIVPYVIVKYIKEKQENKFSIKDLFFYIIKQPKLVFGTCLVPLGLFLFMLFLYFKTGDGLAFVHIQRAWGITDTIFLKTIISGLKDIPNCGFYLSLWAIWGVISVYHLFKTKRFDEGILTLILLVTPLSVRLASIPRYLIGSFFPVVTMCDMIENKNKFEIACFLGLALILSCILYKDWIFAAGYLT